MAFVPLSVSTDDLALFIGDKLNDDRAQLMLDLAVTACTRVVDPLPNAARDVVLSVAAAAYASPVTAAPQAIGPYSVGSTRAGVSLTRQQRRDLRSATGRSNAFNFDVLPVGYPDVRFPA